MGKCKKSKREKKKSRAMSSSSSSDSEYGWTENQRTNECKLAKDSETDHTWMSETNSLESFVDQFTSGSSRQKFQKPDLNQQPGTSLNELNPYWKDGGAGLPKESSITKSLLTADNKSWLRRSYLHCVEQAKNQSCDLKELLLERWDRATVSHMIEIFGQTSHSSSHGAKVPRWRKMADNNRPKREVSPDCHQSADPASPPPIQESASHNPQPPEALATEERLVSAEDINSMAAKLMKAELTGNTAKIAKLKVNLEKLREAQQRGIKVRLHVVRKQSNSDSTARTSTIPLTRLNDHGVEMPISIPNLSSSEENVTKSGKRFQSHDNSGRRMAYFSDDLSGKSLTDLVREEQFRSARDMEEEFTSMAGRSGRNVDDEYADAFISKRDHSSREAMRVKQDAVAAYKRRAVAESSCTICLERVPKHLVISMGEKVFLSLPGYTSMVPGHCLLTPFEHIGSTALLDESIVRELIEFKRRLIDMFNTQLDGSDCIFLETSKRPDSARAHVQLECIPIPRDISSSVPLYFKKALMELGSEWDQNRRLISLKPNNMGAHGSIPPKFGYFAVEFGKSGDGFARVLDDGRDLPSYFGREILGGILDLDARVWRKPKSETFDCIREKVVEFEAWWTPFDKWSHRDPRNSANLHLQSANRSPSPEGPDLPPGL